jgi:hypothetical protein
MASEYNITFLYGFAAASFSFNADTEGKLILTKERCFAEAFSDTTPVLVKGNQPKPKCEADRAYLHYILDCWLDGAPVSLSPSELD